MRASDLLTKRVVDSTGAQLGPVRDARVRRGSEGTLTIVGLVVGGGPFAHQAHAWGFAEGRTQGPWLFRMLTRRATRAARLVRAEQVDSWGDETIRLRCPASDLRPLREGEAT